MWDRPSASCYDCNAFWWGTPIFGVPYLYLRMWLHSLRTGHRT